MPSRRGTARWFWAAGGGAAALAAAVWFAMPVPSLGLTARTVAPGQVRIEWNREAGPVLAGSAGMLEIRDGPAVYRRVLTANQLRLSSFTYAQQSSTVMVRLKVQGGGATPFEEWVRIVGEPPATPAPPEPPVIEAIVQPKPEMEPPKQLEEKPPVVATAAPPPAVAVPAPRPPVFTAPRVNNTVATAPVLPPPPVISSPTLTATLPAVLPPTIPKPSPYTGPRSGRLIWTGTLGRRGVVEVEGNQSSVGALTGALPGTPLSVRVSPAELGPNGLTVYTSDPAANGKVEPAAKSNGWNATRYAFDPERARQIAVLEAPNPSNEFKRLALRSDLRTCNVIVIEWSVR